MTYYTSENIVYRKQLPKVDMTKPINIMVDDEGNKLVADGNHRVTRALQTGEQLKENIIGTFKGKIAQDENYRPVTKLRLSESDPPFSK